MTIENLSGRGSYGPEVEYWGDLSSDNMPFRFRIEQSRLGQFLREELQLPRDVIGNMLFQVTPADNSNLQEVIRVRSAIFELTGKTTKRVIEINLGGEISKATEKDRSVGHRGQLVASKFAEGVAAVIIKQAFLIRSYQEAEEMEKMARRLNRVGGASKKQAIFWQ